MWTLDVVHFSSLLNICLCVQSSKLNSTSTLLCLTFPVQILWNIEKRVVNITSSLEKQSKKASKTLINGIFIDSHPTNLMI